MKEIKEMGKKIFEEATRLFENDYEEKFSLPENLRSLLSFLWEVDVDIVARQGEIRKLDQQLDSKQDNKQGVNDRLKELRHRQSGAEIFKKAQKEKVEKYQEFFPEYVELFIDCIHQVIEKKRNEDFFSQEEMVSLYKKALDNFSKNLNVV